MKKFNKIYKEVFSESSKFDTIETAGIALVADGKVFLVQPFSTKGNRTWGIPKGHVEKGETLEIAARREFSEEVGFDYKNDLEYLGKSGYPSTATYAGKNIHAFVGYGTGKEKFKGSNLIDEGPLAGKPENVDGKYIDIKKALKIVHGSQIALIEMLIKKLNL